MTWHDLVWLVLLGKCAPEDRATLMAALKNYSAVKSGQMPELRGRMVHTVAKYLHLSDLSFIQFPNKAQAENDCLLMQLF